MTRFAGKTALVTGAASGIGAATVARLRAEGAAVLATDIVPVEGAGQGDCIACLHDVSLAADWQRAVDLAASTFGGLDILVNNAGISGETALPIVDTDLEAWRRIMAVNLDGAFLGVKHAMAAMRGRGGAIVNIASIHSFVAAPGTAAYSASKGALTMLTKVAAAEGAAMAPQVRVNSVHPGYVETPLLAARLEQSAGHRDRLVARIPAARLARAEEIASAVAYLAGPDAAYVTGSSLTVDGGYTAV